MIPRTRTALPLVRQAFRTARSASTQSSPQALESTNTPDQSSAESQRKAVIAARIEARQRQAEQQRADAAKAYAESAARNERLNTSQGSDSLIYITAIVLFLATPPTIYFWWQHRAEHMGQKKEAMLAELAKNRAAFDEKRAAR